MYEPLDASECQDLAWRALQQAGREPDDAKRFILMEVAKAMNNACMALGRLGDTWRPCVLRPETDVQRMCGGLL